MSSDMEMHPKDAGIFYQDWAENDEWAALADSNTQPDPAVAELEARLKHSAPQLRRRFGHTAVQGGSEDGVGYAQAS